MLLTDDRGLTEEQRMMREACRAFVDDHVTPFIRQSVDRFAVRSTPAPLELRRPSLRLTIDTRQDLQFVRSLVDQAGATMEDIVQSVRRVADIMGEITAASADFDTARKVLYITIDRRPLAIDARLGRARTHVFGGPTGATHDIGSSGSAKMTRGSPGL